MKIVFKQTAKIKIQILLITILCFLLYQSCKKTLGAFPVSKKAIVLDTIPRFGADTDTLRIICLQTGKALVIENSDTSRGAIAIQYTYLGDTTKLNKNQKWKILDQGTGYYKLMNLGSGKYLGNQGEKGSGIVLSQWVSDTTSAQLWQILKADSISYKIVNKLSGFAVTNSGNFTNNGNAITQQTYLDSLAQHWVLRNVISKSK